jgi:hypothetical protein
VAKVFGAQNTLIGAGVLGALVTFAFLFLPHMRDIERTGVLAGVHLDTAVEPTLDAATAPVEPPSDPHLRPVLDPPIADDPVVAESFETLRSLRVAIERWKTSRSAVSGELETLELEEAELLDRLLRVRTRLDALRAVHEDLADTLPEAAETPAAARAS